MLLDSALGLSPNSVPADGGEHTIQLSYSIGAFDVTRACDRITVGGEERPEKECFPVTGTITSMQPEHRHVQVVAPLVGVDHIIIRVFVVEVDADGVRLGEEQECAASLGIVPQVD
jgi:hypothetical protein